MIAAIEGSDTACIVDACGTAAYSQVKEQEETLVEIPACRVDLSCVVDVHLEIRCLVGVLVEVDIHAHCIIVPHHGVDVVIAVFDRIVGSRLAIHGMIAIGVRPPVHSCIEKLVLRRCLDALGKASLEHVDLAAIGPVHAIGHVVAHEPECRPQAVGRLGQLDAGLNLAMLESHLSHRVDAARGERFGAIRLFLGSNHKVAASHLHIAWQVILQLVVTPAITVTLHIPHLGIERSPVKLVAPHQLVVACCSTRYCRCRCCKQHKCR